MGYNTRHQLEIDPLGENVFIPQCEHGNPEDATFCMTCGKQIGNTYVIDYVWEYIATAAGMEGARYALGEDGDSGESCKWYEHKDDMFRLSQKFPGVLFTLNGEGEESGDLWVEYWVDGCEQAEKAQIVYGKFDPVKLIAYKPRR